jgi:hypothetical protein
MLKQFFVSSADYRGAGFFQKSLLLHHLEHTFILVAHGYMLVFEQTSIIDLSFSLSL